MTDLAYLQLRNFGENLNQLTAKQLAVLKNIAANYPEYQGDDLNTYVNEELAHVGIASWKDLFSTDQKTKKNAIAVFEHLFIQISGKKRRSGKKKKSSRNNSNSNRNNRRRSGSMSKKKKGGRKRSLKRRNSNRRN